jgi:hypothetical protein
LRLLQWEVALRKTMLPAWGHYALLAVVTAACVSGCVDFEQEGVAFCQRNPARCGQETAPPLDTTPPEITRSSQSTTRVLAKDTVSFQVTAQDAESALLRFEWISNVGTLSNPVSTGTVGEVTWTAPLCIPKGTAVAITVTIMNEGGLSASKAFTLSANPCPTPSVSAGRLHSMLLRADGTVLTWGSNLEGQLGDGTTNSHPLPAQISGFTSMTAHRRRQVPLLGSPG